MAFFVDLLILLLDVEFSEEIKGDHRVDIDDDRQQHHSKYQLLSVMGYRLQDGAQGFETDCHVQQMGGEEEIVEVSKNRESEIPEGI